MPSTRRNCKRRGSGGGLGTWWCGRSTRRGWRGRCGRGRVPPCWIARRSRGLRRFAGVEDANEILVHERKEERYERMRQNVASAMEQTGMVGKAYFRRSRRNAATCARALVRDSGGLGAWGGAGSRGNRRGCHRLLIGANMAGNRGIKRRN